IVVTGTGMAMAAGLGVAAPAVLPTCISPRRRATKPTTVTATAMAATANFQLRMVLSSLMILFRCFGVGFERLVRRSGLAAGAALPPLLDDRVENRDEGEREYGGGQHAAEYGGTDGLAAGGAGPGREHQRHHAQDEREGRHQDRPQAQASGLHRGLHDVEAVLSPAFGELHDQYRVHGGQADQHDEADL